MGRRCRAYYRCAELRVLRLLNSGLREGQVLSSGTLEEMAELMFPEPMSENHCQNKA